MARRRDLKRRRPPLTAARLVACIGDDAAWRLMAVWGGHRLPVLTLAAALRRTRDAGVRAAVDGGESYRRVGRRFGCRRRACADRAARVRGARCAPRLAGLIILIADRVGCAGRRHPRGPEIAADSDTDHRLKGMRPGDAVSGPCDVDSPYLSTALGLRDGASVLCQRREPAGGNTASSTARLAVAV